MVRFCPVGRFLLSKGRKNTKNCPFGRKVIQKVETFAKCIADLKNSRTFAAEFIDIVIFYSASRCCHYMPSRVEVH